MQRYDIIYLHDFVIEDSEVARMYKTDTGAYVLARDADTIIKGLKQGLTNLLKANSDFNSKEDYNKYVKQLLEFY